MLLNTEFHEDVADPEAATFVLHKATKIKCCLFLQESPAVAREDALQPI